MISVVTFKWKPPPQGYRSTFTSAHVNILFAMVRRHYPKPFRFICVTDDAKGLKAGVEAVPLWSDHAGLYSPIGKHQPSCYRRLKLFSADAGATFGERIAMLDLDVVITGDLSPLFDRPEPFVIWGDTHPRTFYNGSFYVFSAGAVRELWDDFDPTTSPKRARAAGFFGSDQAWISYRLGAGRPTFGQADGIYSFRKHIYPSGGKLPGDARLVVFHGKFDPWSPIPQRLAWVRSFWRE